MPRVAAFAGQRPAAGCGFVEPGSPPHQVGDGAVAVGDDRPDRVGITQSRARGECVGDMGLDRVVGVAKALRQHHRNAALCVEGGGVPDLAQHDHRAAAAVRGQRRGQAGYAGADDDDVGALAPEVGPAAGGRARHSPPPGCPISIIRCTLARAAVATSGSTCTSSAPSTRQRSNAAGVIIFM